MKIKTRELVFCVALGANVNNADEWWKYSDDQMRGDRSRAQIEMTIKTPDWTRTLEIESDVEGKKEALSTILSPAKEKGIRTLRIENNMWNYFPKLKRKVAVSSSMLLASWMGSDFTNDDILKASSMSSDYSHTFMPDEKIDGEAMRVINNLAKSESKVMWPRIVTLSSKKDCLPRISRYYDKQNNLKRVLTMSDVKTFNNHKVLTNWKMKPTDDKTKETVIIYKSVDFQVKFPSNHFTQKSLTQ
ncbi:MAG: outer membrane lipoprotein-sorting protein [Bacteriovoracaceae bacterium]